MVHARLHSYTFADYLAIEEVARVKHEYLDGEIYALAGWTPEHAALSAVVTTMLGERLRGTACRVYSSDLRVRILETGRATYPDVTVVCGPTQRDPESETHVVNTRVVVEVLSDGTEAYDRGVKLEHYKKRLHQWRSSSEIPALDYSLDVDAVYDAASEQAS